MVLKSLSSGFSAVLQNKRMVLYFYFANLVAGLIIMIPFRSLVSSLVGYSLMGKDLEGGLNMDFILELLIKHSSAFSTVTGLLFLFPFLYWLWNLFLSSGAYGTFIHGTGENANTFWGYSAKYFGRMFRLFLWSIPVIVLLYMTQFAVTLIKTVIWGADAYQNINFWANWLRIGWGYLAIIFYYLIFDYARIILITNDEHRTRKALWQGVRFAFRHPIRTFVLSVIIFLLSQIFFLVYTTISPLFGAPHTFIVILLLFVQQIYIILRMTLRLTLYSAQVNLYNTIELPAIAEVESRV